MLLSPGLSGQSLSPSAWRVWIEMVELYVGHVAIKVTLRMEGVDRNHL